jgi:hypothetical protein
MKILIERTGGFAGFKRRYEIDIDAGQIEALKSFTAKDAMDAKHADKFSYKIIVGSGEDSRSYTLSEEAFLKITGKNS